MDASENMHSPLYTMVFRLLGDSPLPDPTEANCQLDILELATLTLLLQSGNYH